eukprot:8564466-Prorocentrum_lima.AAC.1
MCIRDSAFFHLSGVWIEAARKAMNRRFKEMNEKDSQKMFFASALQQVKQEKEAADAATGIAASTSAAAPPVR